jgi:hypothetical protein
MQKALHVVIGVLPLLIALPFAEVTAKTGASRRLY